MIEEDRIISAEIKSEQEQEVDYALRPKKLVSILVSIKLKNN
tara:strand:- start:8285 stop:8410 length:126 start_codon:yes stop_codon:yes gene_type:complete